MAIYVVRWLDKVNGQHEKAYDAIADARRAGRWLAEQGATEIDIAARIITNSTPMFPASKEAHADIH